MNKLMFELTIDETNIILNSLGKMPYEQVMNLIQKLRDQAAPQLQPPPTPPSSE